MLILENIKEKIVFSNFYNLSTIYILIHILPIFIYLLIDVINLNYLFIMCNTCTYDTIYFIFLLLC